MLPPPKTVGTHCAPASRIASVLLAASACLAGCHSSPRHFTLHGHVVRTDAAATQLTINHGEIPGFMAAKALPYNVKDAQGFGSAEPGDRISAGRGRPQAQRILARSCRGHRFQRPRQSLRRSFCGSGSVRRAGPRRASRQSGRQNAFAAPIQGAGHPALIHLLALPAAELLPADQQPVRRGSQGPEWPSRFLQNPSGQRHSRPGLRSSAGSPPIRPRISQSESRGLRAVGFRRAPPQPACAHLPMLSA